MALRTIELLLTELLHLATSLLICVFSFWERPMESAQNVSRRLRWTKNNHWQKTQRRKGNTYPCFRKQRYRAGFFNSKDGILIRLNLHPHRMKHTHTSKYCALYETDIDRRRSKFLFQGSGVHLCIRTEMDKRSYCWSKWQHAEKLMKESRPRKSFQSFINEPLNVT